MRFRSALLAGTVALASALGLAMTSLAHARGPGGGASFLEDAVGRLDLDSETRASVFAVLDGMRPTERALREQLHSSHDELRALLEAPDADEQEVLAKLDAVSALEAQMHRQGVRTLLQVRGLLSPEQREQLGEIMQPPGRARGDRPGC